MLHSSRLGLNILTSNIVSKKQRESFELSIYQPNNKKGGGKLYLELSRIFVNGFANAFQVK